MALKQPTTVEIRDVMIANIESRLGQTIPLLAKAVFRVFCTAVAGVFSTLYKYGSFNFLQMFPQRAEKDSLVRWGDLVDIIRSPAEATRIEVQCTGTDGQEILTSSKLINNLNGSTYLVDNDATISGGVATVTMVAVNAGSLGNIENNGVLSFVTPLPGIDNKATVTDTLDVGLNAEDLEIYRGRVVDRFRKVPQGGAFVDYQLWATEIASIVNAYPYAGEIEGTVQVFIESSVETDGIPTATEISDVEDSINLPNRRPVTAEVFVLPIDRIGFTVTVFGLIPDTTEARDGIEQFLTDFFLTREPFIQGLSDENISLIAQTEVIQIVSLAVQIETAGFTSAVFEVTGTGDTQIRYNLGQGEKAKLDSVVYA